jgi:gamma-glutamyltranspeptidase/glutathione hydrolase
LAAFKSGLVVSADPLASRAGAKILKKGGNAIDAAVTTAHVLGVAAPAFSGVGGGGFALIWLAREEKPVFVDFREKAPATATEDMFKLTPSGKVVRKENAVGYKAVAVPGAISGHASILESYGTLRLKETLDDATKIARRGFQVGRALAYAWKLGTNKLRGFKESRSTYLRRGRPIREGGKIALPSLARTLANISREGPQEIYHGGLARKIVKDMEANSGLITATDLDEYNLTVREPVRGTYKDFEIVSAPPPSSGGAIIVQSLNILENFPPKGLGDRSTQALHLLAEALARGYMSCGAAISDPAFSHPPMERLVSKAFGKELASTISPNVSSIPASPSAMPPMPASNTTHLVAIDAEHNIVSLTESIECYFGSGVTVPGTGVLLNDTMHDFEPRPQMANSVAPGKIPMSSMSPTLILKEGRPILALGGAGGPRIVSSTLEVLLNVIEYGLGLQDAVAQPRLHMNGSLVQLEEPLGSAAKELRKMGHTVEIKKPTGSREPILYFGGVHAAQLLEDGSLVGASDPRRDGLAIGL